MASFPCLPEGAVREVLAASQGQILHFSSDLLLGYYYAWGGDDRNLVPHSLDDDTGLESSQVGLSMGTPRPTGVAVDIEEMEWTGDENVEAVDGEDDVEEVAVGTDEVRGID